MSDRRVRARLAPHHAAVSRGWSRVWLEAELSLRLTLLLLLCSGPMSLPPHPARRR